IDWMQAIDPIALDNTEILDKAVESWTNCIVEAGEATIGIKTIWKEKHQHMVNSISSLHEGNTRNLFAQFKALSTNKICIIPELVNKETNSAARSYVDKAYLLHCYQMLNGCNSIQEFLKDLLYPILFLLYINDLTIIQQPIQCGMFADDVALWTSIFTNDVNELLQQSLDE
ncbi:hypothetical protein RFI_38365, partial [Reticulomyxa filosa]